MLVVEHRRPWVRELRWRIQDSGGDICEINVHMISGPGASTGWNVLLTARLICLVSQQHRTLDESGNSVLRNVAGSEEAVGWEMSSKVMVVF